MSDYEAGSSDDYEDEMSHMKFRRVCMIIHKSYFPDFLHLKDVPTVSIAKVIAKCYQLMALFTQSHFIGEIEDVETDGTWSMPEEFLMLNKTVLYEKINYIKETQII